MHVFIRRFTERDYLYYLFSCRSRKTGDWIEFLLGTIYIYKKNILVCSLAGSPTTTYNCFVCLSSFCSWSRWSHSCNILILFKTERRNKSYLCIHTGKFSWRIMKGDWGWCRWNCRWRCWSCHYHMAPRIFNVSVWTRCPFFPWSFIRWFMFWIGVFFAGTLCLLEKSA